MSTAITEADLVAVPRSVLAEMQKNAALGAKMYGARDFVVTEARAASTEIKGLAAPLGIGAILAWANDWESVKNSETVKKHWWLLPVAVLAAGYILKRRGSAHATAIMAIGAALFVQAYRANEAREAAAKQTQQTTSPTKPATDTAGPDPEGPTMPVMYPIDDRTAWIHSNGQWVRVQIAAPQRPALQPPQQGLPQTQTVQQDNAAALAAAAFAA